MEQQVISNSTIVNHRGKQFGLQELLSLHQKISVVEKRVAAARMCGVSMSQMEPDDLIHQLEETLIKISVTSGHGLPEAPLFAEVLVSELKNFLLAYGYDNFTISEILLAFRLNCLCNLRYPSGAEVTPTEIFGKSVSVDYISKVLGTYRVLRNMLDNNLKNFVDGY